MSLKQVSLDPYLLAQLYKSAVVPSEKAKSIDDTLQRIKFLGNNTRHITILIYNKEQSWLPEALYTFLTKILQACGLSMEDVALVNRAFLQETSLSDVVEQLATEKLILLGSFFREWPGPALEKNKKQSLEGRPCLFSDSLQELQSNAQLKKEFWSALQEFFELKK